MTLFCELFGYSRQAYYKRSRSVVSGEAEERRILTAVLSFRRTMPRLGVRKLHYLLGADGIRIGRDRLFALLRKHNLLVPKRNRYFKTTDSRHWMHRHPNLVKRLVPTRPEQVWVADITYLSGRRSPKYLHLVTDAYSKRIMGYEVSGDLATKSTLKALRMAIGQRRYPDLPLVHHSDRGLQYCSHLYTDLLTQKKIRISMTEDGSPYDNAVAERVNGILKQEFGLDHLYDNWAEVQKATDQSITTYNQRRPHLSCHYLTPDQMHKQNLLPMKTWRKKSRPVH